MKSKGILSDKTIVAMHPWVKNLNRELAQIEEDKAAELEEMNIAMKPQAKNNPKPTPTGGDA